MASLSAVRCPAPSSAYLPVTFPVEIWSLITQCLSPGAPSLPEATTERHLIANVDHKQLSTRSYDIRPDDPDSRLCATALRALCLVSSWTYEIAKPVLYENIVLRTGSSMVLLLRTLLQAPSLCTPISQISIAFSTNHHPVVRDVACAWQRSLQPCVDLGSLPDGSRDLLAAAHLDWGFRNWIGPTEPKFFCPPIGDPRECMSVQIDDVKRISSVLVSLATTVETALTVLDRHSRFQYSGTTTLRLNSDHWSMMSHSVLNDGGFVWLAGFPDLLRVEASLQCPGVISDDQNSEKPLEEFYFHCSLPTPAELPSALMGCGNLRALEIHGDGRIKSIASQEEFVHFQSELKAALERMPRLRRLRLPLAWRDAIPQKFDRNGAARILALSWVELLS
ncbi:hypothetical protein GGS23DRAFT_599400 [Durotheca rogersii]|uniref:uncharacterized protein n=1 Tax=Durotheca rogersii TaxID=419775 RepID=UPI0022211354|nr:uncharacterized protein GGS23DRAFT_599400 [Durotheca rogersii]KAI5860592.1 hypothetical protein GGS23DRAFT_599400 [Durotheca rogersii]